MPSFGLDVVKLLLAAITLRCVVVYSYRLLIHPLRSYPGPFIAKLTDWYSAYYAFQRSLHRATYRDHQKYGPVIRQGPNKLVFNSAQALHDIYQNERLFKASAYLVTQAAPSVFNLFNVIDKRLHRIKRRIIGQGLNERAIRQFEPVMDDQITIFLRQLAKSCMGNALADMSERCSWLGLDISGELAFGHGFELQTDTKNRWLPKGISMANFRINLYIQFPELKYTGWEKLLLPYVFPNVRRFHDMIIGMIKTRLSEEKNARPDIFSSVSDYKDPETGEGLGERELWSESTFLIPAGGDTTTTLMTAAFFYLSRYPRAYYRLASEIRSTFATSAEIKSGPKLSGCRYLRALLEETLRMTPPVNTTLWRELPANANTDPVVIDGHAIPPGTRIGVNIYTIHHNEAYFPEPFVFKPERWIPGESQMNEEEMKAMQDAFTPFSIGSRACAGKAMAYLEASLVLAKTLWYFDFERPRGDASDLDEGTSPVFHTGDQFGSYHTGPRLKFRLREEGWRELDKGKEKMDL